jgi:hypothetical protein
MKVKKHIMVKCCKLHQRIRKLVVHNYCILLIYETSLLTNATAVDNTIRFVSQMSKEKLKSANAEDDKDQLEEDRTAAVNQQ